MKRFAKTAFFCFVSCEKEAKITDDGAFLKVRSSFGVLGKVEECYHIQGGCVVGNRVYYALLDQRNDTNNFSCVLEYDMNGNFIRKTGMLDLGHANDMTFVPEMNAIAVPHCDLSGKISYISLDDLSVIETRTFGIVRGIEYLGSDKYVFACFDAICLAEWKSDKFEVLTEYDLTETGGISQGIYSNGDRLFDLRMPDDDRSIVNIFDLNSGEYLKTVKVEKIGGEPEFVCVYENRFVIGTSGNYRVNIADCLRR